MKKAPTKKEREHMAKVASLGCCICRRLGYGETPAEVHHIRDGQGVGKRASHLAVIPLCPPHHRTGGHGVAYHAGKDAWEKAFNTTEAQLLVETLRLVVRN